MEAHEFLSRAEYAYEQLLGRIRRGEFRSGQRLTEAALAAQLNVSRTPVREGLRRLAADGLIEIAPGRGMMITRYDQSAVRELYFLRKVLEGAAASQAAQHATAEDIATMRFCLKKFSASPLEPHDFARINLDLHQAIHDAARNNFLNKALSQLSDSLSLLPGTTFAYPGRASAALAEHSAIVDAIENRDAAKAEELARNHIEQAAIIRMAMMFDKT